jgi:Zn-dependent M28 family amino/carboxypeptidase
MRISAKSGLRGPKDAILLGSHIDSTISAPGAADDGLGVGVMLDLARVMIERNEPFNGSVIFGEFRKNELISVERRRRDSSGRFSPIRDSA